MEFDAANIDNVIQKPNEEKNGNINPYANTM